MELGIRPAPYPHPHTAPPPRRWNPWGLRGRGFQLLAVHRGRRHPGPQHCPAPRGRSPAPTTPCCYGSGWQTGPGPFPSPASPPPPTVRGLSTAPFSCFRACVTQGKRPLGLEGRERAGPWPFKGGHWGPLPSPPKARVLVPALEERPRRRDILADWWSPRAGIHPFTATL